MGGSKMEEMSLDQLLDLDPSEDESVASPVKAKGKAQKKRGAKETVKQAKQTAEPSAKKRKVAAPQKAETQAAKNASKKKPAKKEEKEEEVEENESEEEPEQSSEEAGSGEEGEEKVSQTEQHKRELAELEKTDPEFYKFLKESNEELLHFGEGEEEEPEEEEDEAEIETDEAKEEEDDTPTITLETLKTIENRILKQNSINALNRFLKIFRVACHLTDDEKSHSSKPSKEETEFDERVAEAKVKIADGKVFNRLMTWAFTHMHEVLAKLLKGKEGEEGKLTKPTESAQFPRLQNAIKSYCGNLAHFLLSLVEPEMVRVVLKHTQQMLPCFTAFPKLAARLLKFLLQLWGASQDHSTQVDAFLQLRALVLEDSSLLDPSLKGIFQVYLRNSKFTNDVSMNRVIFLGNCVAELYAINAKASYQHAFVFIRQLAMSLRAAVTTKSKESYRAVYNWQFMNAMRVWSKILSTQCNLQAAGASDITKHELYPLLYPLTQVIIRAAQLVSSPRYFPYRFMCCSMLIQLAKATGVFIPVSPIILAVLQSPQMTKHPRAGTEKPPRLDVSLKVSEAISQTKAFQDVVFDEVVRLSLQYFGVYSRCVAFPDMVVPAAVALRRFAKNSKVPRFTKGVQTVLAQLDRNAAWVSRLRSSLDLNPRAIQTINCFPTITEQSPLDVYVKALGFDKERKAPEPETAQKGKTPQKGKQQQKAAEKKKKEEEEEESDDGLFDGQDEEEEDVMVSDVEEDDGEEEEEEEEGDNDDDEFFNTLV